MQLARHIDENTVMVPVGKIDNDIYVAVESKAGTELCEGCELKDTAHCPHVKCSAINRKSGNEVIFVKRGK